jgi:hypothetical protein
MRRPLIAGLIVALTATVAIGSGLRSRPFAPDQPIDFSHRTHIRSADQLECELCHSAARRSSFAEVAPIERCMGCHRYVLTRHPEVAKLQRAWESGKTIEWVKVYTLPRFVRFNHEAHALGGVTCDVCHGDVGSMNRITRVSDLSMRWCVTCHRDRRASIDCLTCHY